MRKFDEFVIGLPMPEPEKIEESEASKCQGSCKGSECEHFTYDGYYHGCSRYGLSVDIVMDWGYE